MLDSLKDLYVCYPFLPVSEVPEWFKHIKDVRCVVTLGANSISKYKNGNFVRAWLMSINSSGATIRILVGQALDGYTTMTVPVKLWTDLVPSNEQSYVLVDEDFDGTDEITGEFELNPGVLVIMQTAPAIYVDGVKQPAGIRFTKGFNVEASKAASGVLVYGGAGLGLGVYKTDPLGVLGYHEQGLGARNLNGMYGSVRIDGTFPVDVDIRPDGLQNRPVVITIEGDNDTNS